MMQECNSIDGINIIVGQSSGYLNFFVAILSLKHTSIYKEHIFCSLHISAHCIFQYQTIYCPALFQLTNTELFWQQLSSPCFSWELLMQELNTKYCFKQGFCISQTRAYLTRVISPFCGYIVFQMFKTSTLNWIH